MFSGKINRAKYFVQSLVLFGVSIFLGLSYIPSMMYAMEVAPADLAMRTFGVGIVFTSLALICLFAYGVVLTAKRLRDLNYNAWLCLIMFIPYVNVVFWVYLCLIPSKPA